MAVANILGKYLTQRKPFGFFQMSGYRARNQSDFSEHYQSGCNSQLAKTIVDDKTDKRLSALLESLL
tara:strand:+ start:160 stop:360 length:201 start_codon:yes stop_codon:yes gene_type:complete